VRQITSLPDRFWDFSLSCNERGAGFPQITPCVLPRCYPICFSL
jgi:hypothetical protein